METPTRAGIVKVPMEDSKLWHRLKEKNLFFKRKRESPAVSTVQSTDYLYAGYRILGVNMPAQHRIPYIIYSVILNGLVTVFLPLAFVFSFLVSDGSEAELQIGNLLTSVQVAINVWGCAVKIIIMGFMIKKLRVADEVMGRLDKRCVDEDEIAELHKIVRMGRRLVVLFAMAYWSYATSTFLSSILFGRPPYSLYLPFINWRNSRLEFLVSSLIEFILMDFACFQQVVDDSYAVIYVCILRAHMQILLLRVRKLGSNKELSQDENMEELKLCVKDHKTLLELYNIVTPIISITIFIQFAITALLLGITLINILIFATDFSARVASCFYILAVVVEIFPLCYYAQCLINDSNQLAEHIFHSDWIDQGSKYGKMLAFFMQHTQRSMELTAGKLFPITLNSFVSIAKFSFSLYTLIKKMGIKERLQAEQEI